MSDVTDQGGTAQKSNPNGARPTQGHHMLSDDWEERLAVARAQREKVLKAKGKPAKKPKVERPRFLDADAGTEFRHLGGAVGTSDRKAPPERSESNVSEHLREAAKVAATFRAADQSARQPVARTLLGSVSRLATIAFACFFGLGFGMVLSFGVVVAMGWVSWNQIAPAGKGVETLAQIRADDVQTTVESSMAATTPIATDAEFQRSLLTSVSSQSRGAPKLHSASRPDRAPATVQSPPPRFDATAVANELVARSDFQPATIEVTFETPLRLAVKQALLQAQRPSRDVVPVLPEKGSVTTPTLLASLTPPVSPLSSPTAKVASDVVFVRMPMPTLFSSKPEDALGVLSAAPKRLVVFDAGISSLSLESLNEVASLPSVPALDASLSRELPVRAPLAAFVTPKLPAIGGPPEFKPNLAFKLGLGQNEAKQFTLVTFAPTDVSDDRMARNTATLDATGFPVAQANRVNFKVSKTHVRYYNKEDETVARAVAAELGGRARDFTTARNPPPPGRVEIWLNGNKKTAAGASKPKRTASVAQRRAVLKSRLQNRLVGKLQRGEHLGSGSR